MLVERSCVYNMLINLMETREAGKRHVISRLFIWLVSMLVFMLV